jgi:hypothetical protein
MRRIADSELSARMNRSGAVLIEGGRRAAAEIKRGASEIDKGVKNLLRLRDSVDRQRMPPPSFMMVLTAGEYGYRRKDGVFVVPIGCLKD